MKSPGSRVLVLCTGKDGNPANPKIAALTAVGVARGFTVEIPNFADLPNPEQRVKWLLHSDAAEADCLVLAGVSMGGYVATVAAETLPARGLFLVGPALYLPPYANLDPRPEADLIGVVHGLEDEVVPVANIRRFAAEFGAQAHLLDGNHSLDAHLPFISAVFGRFLDQVVRL
jgi:pimeloyl-ACP methyl ester carboxylesterase